jgi:hypothetical protein
MITRNLHNLVDSDKPTIKILLYTDDPKEVVEGVGPPFGLGSMINHLSTHPLAFANLSITWAGRYPGLSTRALNRINTLLAKEEETTNEPFDQIWFFGLHQINRQTFTLGIGGGGPESELDAKEVEALKSAMDKGLGVLITGDHANQRPLDAIATNPNPDYPDPLRGERFLGLGRALGRCIPRAGALRDWEGKPTAHPLYSFNTQVVIFGANVDSEIAFQTDATPQQLILRTFNERGKPSIKGRPHPLFFYRLGQAIQLFPDHLHEGAVRLPNKLDEKVWPKVNGVQPAPRIVAYGLDKRNGRRLNLIAAYDGDMVNTGRIVADSTWHHYFNTNLRGFPATAEPCTPGDQIGQFYSNLALWLTPRHKRSLMADTMSRWISQQPHIAEVVGPQPSKRLSDIINTGSTAMKLLASVASDCEIHELFQLVVSPSRTKRYETLYFPEKDLTLSPLPSKELLLGSLIHGVPQEPAETISKSMFNEARVNFRYTANVAASELAFKKQKLRIERAVRLAQRFFQPDV